MRPPPIFWVFNSPSPRPPGADGPHRERGHVGRHCPYTNNIWYRSVHALLRYRSKTAKMQKFPNHSHSNENFICLFFRPPGAAIARQPPNYLVPVHDVCSTLSQNFTLIAPSCVEISSTVQINKQTNKANLIWLRCFIHRLISPMHQTCITLMQIWCIGESTGE